MRWVMQLAVVFWVMFGVGCGIYSPYGASTAGAESFSVAPFEVIDPLASATAALALAEDLRDRVQRQTTLALREQGGDCQFSADIVKYQVTPVNVQGNETAATNRLTIALDVTYSNAKAPDQDFRRTFSRFADYPSSSDLFSLEESLLAEIADQISQDIFNASLGNW